MRKPYCTCDEGRALGTHSRTELIETKVDKEGACSYCGYYPVWKDEEDKGNPALRAEVRRSEVESTAAYQELQEWKTKAADWLGDETLYDTYSRPAYSSVKEGRK